MIKITDGKNVLVVPASAFDIYKNSGWQLIARKKTDSIVKAVANTSENKVIENIESVKNSNKRRKNK
jgi:hypothetical protein